MNTQQLESFVQVAENLNFARAAEALNITQSAVSRQIRSLEEELGTRLLHRSTRTVALTPAGISFLTDAKEVLARLQLSAQKLRSHSNANIQVLSIGCSNESCLSLLTPLLQKCRTQFPEIHPFFRIVPFRAILNLFLHDEIDILFGFRDDIPMQDGLAYCELMQLPVCLAMPDGHPFARKDMIGEQEVLADHLVICHSYELPAQAAGLQTQLSSKFPPERLNYCENLQTMLTLIQAGYGLGILPQIPSAAANIRYVPYTPAVSLSYGFFYRSSSCNPLTDSFLSLVEPERNCHK
jgi:DNA-binding transcriptional LysR family regulator